jgi:hypothetical protein
MPIPKQTAVALLLLATILSQTACAVYKRYPMDMKRLDKVGYQSLNFYLLDAAHPYTRGWYMVRERTNGNAIEGFVSRMAEIEVLEVKAISSKHDAAMSRNDVLIYIEPDFAQKLSDTATVKIGKKEVVKIEVTEIDQARTFAPCLIGCNALLILAYLIDGNW